MRTKIALLYTPGTNSEAISAAIHKRGRINRTNHKQALRVTNFSRVSPSVKARLGGTLNTWEIRARPGRPNDSPRYIVYTQMARKGGDRLRQEILTTDVMHAGLPYAAR